MENKNKNLTDSQRRKVLAAADIVQNGDLAVLKKIVEFTDVIEEHTQKVTGIEQQIEETITKAKAVVESLKSETDSKLAEVKDGNTPTKEELLSLIGPLIPPPSKDGKSPTKKELQNLIRPLIPIVLDGVNPDPEDVVPLVIAKMPKVEPFILKRLDVVQEINKGKKNDLKIEAKQIEGLDKMHTDTLNRAVSILDQRTKFLINKIPTNSGSGTVGPGTINQIAYFDTATTVNSLTTVTYPSLTELSYVKGTTSNIQAQINGLISGGVADGDKGDITVSGSGTIWTIDNAAVTLAKMADLAQDQFIGRTTASTGVPQTATITAAARTVLDDTTVGAMVDTLGGASAVGTGGLVRATSPGFTTAANPVSNDGATLGTTALQWSDLFLAEGGVINWDNGDATLTQASNMVTLAGADLTVPNLTDSAMTLGSVLFAGTAGLVSQDNTNFFWNNTDKQLRVGLTGASFDSDSRIRLAVVGNVNDYSDMAVQNLSTGDAATADFFASADNDNPTLIGHYTVGGITGSGWNPTAAGNIKTVSITAAGTGYSVGNILTLSTGDANGEVTVATVGGGGNVTSVTLTNNGTGYSTGAGQATTGGAGSGCTINVLSLIDFTMWGANDGYYFNSGGHLVISTDTSAKVIKFSTGGIGTTNERFRIADTKVTVGLAGTTLGKVDFAGSTSTFITVQGAAVGGSSVLTLYPHTANIATETTTTEASNATPTVAIAASNHTHTITALAAAATFGAPTIASGTLNENYKLIIRIKDNGTARVLAWNAIFRASTDLALPVTTAISKTMYVGFRYNTASTTWDLVSLTDGF